LSENDKEQGRIKVFPNPSNGKFTFQGANSQIEIYNELGSKVYSSLVKSTMEIDMSSQPIGIYFYRVIDNKGEMLKADKVVIVR
jgi:hypothetical protein